MRSGVERWAAVEVGRHVTDNLGELVSDFRDRRILVVGDVMLDRFVYGQAKRISPEAPIPVLTTERETMMLGGAGNVARNIASLGGEAVLIGLIGRDHAGEILRGLLASEPRIVDGLITTSARPTTEKTRYIAERQQILRVDRESAARAQAEASGLLEAFLAQLPLVDAVVLSDYAKGVLCEPGPLIAAARAAGKPIVVDPKSLDFTRYDGATVITPNSAEAAVAAGISIANDADAQACAEWILAGVPKLTAALVTRGANGMTLAERGQPVRHIAGEPRNVFDVSGAGDTAVAALVLGIAAGGGIANAAKLANVAAGVAVTAVGTAAVSAVELNAELQAQRLHGPEARIVSLPRAITCVERWRVNGERIGFTNGCFDLIHPGHISLLTQARAACDRLVVGLNSDNSVRRLKGAARPIQDETARAIVLASLSTTDLVVIFEEDTPEALIQALRPEVLVKGSDYTVETVVGADFVQNYGGTVLLAQLTPGQSTSGIIARMGNGSFR